MKFVGLICAWGVENWIKLAITQALKICDEVIVSIGAHCEQVKKYEDNTIEICQQFKNIKLIPTVYTGHHNTTKAATMNAMLKSSENFKINNWVFLLDVDEFYHESDINDLKKNLTNYNAAIIRSKIFFINMEKYILGDHYRAWRITSEDCQFQPTNRWTGAMQPIYQSDPIMYHYTFLLNPQAKIDFWKNEFKVTKQNDKVKWMKEIYLKYDLNEEEYWLDQNFKLFGKRRPSGPHDFGWPNEKLLDLDSKHPDIIENSSLRHIKDWRIQNNQYKL